MERDPKQIDRLWQDTLDVVELALDRAKSGAELMTILTSALVFAASRDEQMTEEYVVGAIRTSWAARPPLNPPHYDA